MYSDIFVSQSIECWQRWQSSLFNCDPGFCLQCMKMRESDRGWSCCCCCCWIDYQHQWWRLDAEQSAVSELAAACERERVPTARKPRQRRFGHSCYPRIAQSCHIASSRTTTTTSPPSHRRRQAWGRCHLHGNPISSSPSCCWSCLYHKREYRLDGTPTLQYGQQNHQVKSVWMRCVCHWMTLYYVCHTILFSS